MLFGGVALKLIGAGLSTLDGIDPNRDNFVCAGVVHTTSYQIGCLVRLEPNKPAMVRACFILRIL